MFHCEILKFSCKGNRLADGEKCNSEVLHFCNFFIISNYVTV